MRRQVDGFSFAHVTFCSLLEKRKDFRSNIPLTIVQTGADAGTQFSCYTICFFISNLKFHILFLIFVLLSFFVAIILFLLAVLEHRHS